MTFTQRDWEGFLTQELGQSVSVRFGKARKTVIQWSGRRGGAIYLRMNSFFETAPIEVRESVRDWIRHGKKARGAMSQLHRWTETEIARLPKQAVRRQSVRVAGQWHNLEQIAHSLWPLFERFALDPRERPTLSWGQSRNTWRRFRRRVRRRIRLGSYDHHAHLIRVHPALDQLFVPDWFIRYILFHELLHAELGVERTGVYRRVHGPEFRRRERAYAEYARSMEWEKQNLMKLLASK